MRLSEIQGTGLGPIFLPCKTRRAHLFSKGLERLITARFGHWQ